MPTEWSLTLAAILPRIVLLVHGGPCLRRWSFVRDFSGRNNESRAERSVMIAHKAADGAR